MCSSEASGKDFADARARGRQGRSDRKNFSGRSVGVEYTPSTLVVAGIYDKKSRFLGPKTRQSDPLGPLFTIRNYYLLGPTNGPNDAPVALFTIRNHGFGPKKWPK